MVTRGPVSSCTCSSVVLWNGVVAAGYGNGQIRLWEAGSGQIRAQVSAHARWIYALDLAPLTGKVRRGQGSHLASHLESHLESHLALHSASHADILTSIPT